jgi:hypothetical protein
MGLVVTYDVGSRREDVTGVMLGRGYSRGWTIDGVAYTLPDGSLWHETASTAAAIADIRAAAEYCGAELAGAMVVQTTPWAVARTAGAPSAARRETIANPQHLDATGASPGARAK